MSELTGLARGNADPRGKPRVWFCCHPADQALFLQPVCRELWALHDCAVWYDPQPEEPSVWLFRRQDLAQMQLFVLPVTARLLEENCPARERELPFAMEQHIPVLPILEQPGLAERFNQVFGNLQCLDPRQNGPAALPYADKLRTFLDGVLIGSELSARIEAEFSGRLFLSYRKDDRYLARQLMRSIHEQEPFRDVAIWYDEFLVPGHPFDSAIREAMEGSDALVLTVTPNLLLRPNYVMDEEYPTARETGIPVLPVEMEPTDPVRLARDFPGLPPCADFRAAGPLADRLRQILAGRTAARPSGPEHEYLIGLAYLGGIRTETDPTRAARLIRSAAEAGWPEAMEKLAAMYRTGEGVERDEAQARAWLQRLTGQRLDRWQAGGRSPELFAAAARALKALGDDQQANDCRAEARQTWQQLLTLCEEAHQPRDPAVRRQKAVACFNLSVLCRRQQNWQEAEAWLEKDLALTAPLAREQNTPQALRDLALSRDQQGRLLLDQGKPGAVEAFRQAALLLEQAARRSGAPIARQEAAEGYLQLAYVCRQQKDEPAARAALEQGRQIAAALLDEENTPAARRLLSRILRIQSTRESTPETALALARQAWDTAEPLREEYPDGARELARAGSRLLVLKQRDPAARQAICSQLLPLRRELVKRTGAEEDRLALARDLVIAGLASMLGSGGKSGQAAYLEEAIQLLETPGKPLSGEQRRILANAYRALSELRKQEDDPSVRQACLERYLALERELCRQPDGSGDAASAYLSALNLAELYRAQGKADAFQAAMEEALELAARIPSGTATPKREVLAGFCLELANGYLARGDRAARRWLEQGRELLEQMAREGREKAPDIRLDCYRQLAGLCRQEGYPAAAHRWLDQCREGWQPAADRGDRNARRKLAEALWQLGQVCREEQTLSDARARLEQALNLWEELCRDTGDARDLSNRETARLELADVLRDEGRTDEARKLYLDALKGREALLARKYDPDQQYRLGVICLRLADLCQRQQDLPGARYWLERQRDLAKELLQQNPGSLPFRRLMSHALLRLADLLQDEGQPGKAQELLEESLAQLEQISCPTLDDRRLKSSLLDRMARLCNPEDPARPQYQARRVQELRALADSTRQPEAWRKLADACRTLADQPGAALSWREEQARALEQAAVLSGAVQDQRAWGKLCSTLSDTFRSRRETDKALAWQQKGHIVFSRLWETCGEESDGFSLALAEERLGLLHSQRRERTEARHRFVAEQALALELQRRTFSRQNRRLSVYALEALADLERDEGTPQQALLRYGESLAAAEAICRDFAGDNSLSWELDHRRYCLVEQARIQENRGELYEARLLLDKAAICCRDQLALREDPKVRARMADYFARLSNLSGRLADKPGARRWQAAACRETARVAANTHAPADWQKLATCWEELARLRREAGDDAGVLECLHNIRDAAEGNFTALPTANNLACLMKRENDLADFLQNAGKRQEALQIFRRCLAWADEAPGDLAGAAVSRQQLAYACFFLGKEPGQRACMERAAELWQQLAAEYPDKPHFASNLAAARRCLNQNRG